MFGITQRNEMRDERRIPIVLKAIEQIWLEYPDLRLGQLIQNVMTIDDYLYFIEDDVLVERLKQFYGLN